ncbi:ChrR family anti-sigma-E factor [uncultured Shewanella sp.]|uniref:ChrR family anti-sigma-E factor n=1 Tax=Shewanella atlantica TaxID=271099 RepID=UPI002612AD7D|nr:ChrR family anti-sigma-E factor [uncultured Shewanella sp.]
MIKLHPKRDILSSFVSDELPVSLSVIVSSHVELCPCCQSEIQVLTEQAANACFAQADTFSSQNVLSYSSEHEINVADIALDELDMAMFNSITDELPGSREEVLSDAFEAEFIDVCDVSIPMPRALRTLEMKPFQGLGKLSRSRVLLEDGALRTSLLHIETGGSVPTHTHKGFEVTLLLQGSFEDEMGTYHAGDFIWLDGNHTHQPVTKTGCVCLTVSNDAIHFTKGMSQLLNPIGQFIY